MFRRLTANGNNLDEIMRVETIVRSRFQIGSNNIILVSEDPVEKPGFPPFETNIIFWINDIRYRQKIFLRVCEVTEEDVPIKWLLPSLEDDGEADCC